MSRGGSFEGVDRQQQSWFKRQTGIAESRTRLTFSTSSLNGRDCVRPLQDFRNNPSSCFEILSQTAGEASFELIRKLGRTLVLLNRTVSKTFVARCGNVVRCALRRLPVWLCLSLFSSLHSLSYTLSSLLFSRTIVLSYFVF